MLGSQLALCSWRHPSRNLRSKLAPKPAQKLARQLLSGPSQRRGAAQSVFGLAAEAVSATRDIVEDPPLDTRDT